MDIMKKMQIQQAIKESKEIEGEFIDICHIVAQQLRHFYIALIEKGFTEDQTLKIVIVQGVSPGNYNGSVK